MSKVKTYCYSGDCVGPVVTTGFHHSQYKVCKACKEEVSDKLAEDIEYRKKKKDAGVIEEEHNLWAVTNTDDEYI